MLRFGTIVSGATSASLRTIFKIGTLFKESKIVEGVDNSALRWEKYLLL